MLAAEVSFPPGKLPGDVDRALALDVADDVRDGIVRRYAHTHMHMLRHHMSLNDLRFFVPGQLMENLPEMAAQLAENSLPASFWDDNDVVLTVPARVAQSLVLFQAWLSASLGAERKFTPTAGTVKPR